MDRPCRLLIVTALSLSGCVNPFNTRFPDLAPRSTQYEQAQARVQDPFPDAETGPDIGFRPLDYQQQRSEETLAKERANAAFLRQQIGVPGGGTAPGANGSMYPEAVRQ